MMIFENINMYIIDGVQMTDENFENVEHDKKLKYYLINK